MHSGTTANNKLTLVEIMMLISGTVSEYRCLMCVAIDGITFQAIYHHYVNL